MQKLFFLISLFLFVSAAAQTPNQYTFTHYTTSSGLLSNQLNTVVQDADGYIWTGSTDGLQRFDGIRYKSFRHRNNDNTSLPSNPISQLLIDRKKNLWVLMADGETGIFNTKNFSFQTVPSTIVEERTLKYALKRLVKDEYGHVFLLLAGNQVLTWDTTKNVFTGAANFFLQKPEWLIADFVQQPGTQKYWISIQGGGLAIYNHATKTLSYSGHNVEQEPAIDLFNDVNTRYDLMFDSKARLWYSTWGSGLPYLYCYDIKKSRLILDKFECLSTLKSYYETHGFFEQKDGSIWVKGAQIFAKYIEKEKKFQIVYNGYLNERSIAFEEVTSICEDREQNIWVGTSNNGLYRFNPAQQYFSNFPHVNRLSGMAGNGSPMSFAYTKWGTLFVGTWGDGLYHYDKDLHPVPIGIKGFDEKQSHSIWGTSLSKDKNTIWLAAQPGIFAVNQDKRTSVYHNPVIMDNKTVRQIAEDKFGNLWLGMQRTGLFKWDAIKGKRKFDDGIKKLTAYPAALVNKIMIDSKGNVWVAYGTEGVFAIDPATEKELMHFGYYEQGEKKLPEEGVSSVLEYDDSTMVITTRTNILLYNRIRQKSTLIRSSETMSGFISAVERDTKGYLWVSTTSGLYRVNIHSQIFVRFGGEDGIDNDNFILAASAKLPDGRLLFGSSNQFLVFNPLAIVTSTTYPKVMITDFKVKNKSFLVDSLLHLQEVSLLHDQNSLNIEFSTLSYSNAYIIRYKMEGLDKDWKIADKNNQAVYTYLPPGNYTLMLQLLDEEGIAADEITRLKITLSPPFYKSWWFYSIIILLTGSLIYWFDRERMKRKEVMQKMRTDIADNLHQEINTALNNINILSEMAKLKAENNPQKSKEYIEQIHSRSHNMMIAMDDMLWSIDPQNDHMGKTVDRMKEYVDALQNRHGADIEIFVDKKVQSLELNMKLRHEAFLLFKEALKSLVLAGAEKCDIYIGLEKSKLLFTMQFANDSCDIQQLNSLLHRQDMEKRLQSIRAILDVEVHKSNSMFVLQVPVD